MLNLRIPAPALSIPGQALCGNDALLCICDENGSGRCGVAFDGFAAIMRVEVIGQ